MKWQKLQVLGRGSFGTVYLAVPVNPYITPVLIAVKSSLFEYSFSLQKEARILGRFSDCSEIVRWLGVDLSINGGLLFYDLLLEYASGGTLKDLIKRSGGKLQEYDIRKYTQTILKGLRYIHEQGYVHCDLKPANILVFCSQEGVSSVKITDFGLAKIPGEENEFMRKKFAFRGTPVYMSPESVLLGEIEAPLDIWSLGCIVVEMVTGHLAWDYKGMDELKDHIAFGNESPKIAETMSEHGKDFLRRCFARDPMKRWTAEMLLHHPFLVETQGLPSTERALGFSSSVSKKPLASKNLPPPPGFSSISKKPSSPKKVPPPGFSSVSKKQSLMKNLPPPPGFSSISKKQPLPNKFTAS